MADDAHVDFGATLRQARERRGVSLQQIAATTKISARVLEALERNDASRLPGGIFSRAFVRAYAREVGLDPEAIVEQFIDQFPPESALEGPVITSGEDPEAFESGRRAATTFLQLVGISLVVIVAVFMYLNMRSAAPPAEVPATESSPSPEPAVVPGPALPVAPPAVGEAGSPPADVPARPAAGEQAVPASASASAPAPGPQAPLRLVLVARTACWVSLTVDGTRVVGRTLEAGERVTSEARTEAVLNVGDAAALSMTINEVPVRALGGAGQVVTTRITPDNYRTLLQAR